MKANTGKLIFVGEHTSHTHAWIASALESGIRGGVQLLLGKIYKNIQYSEADNCYDRTRPDRRSEGDSRKVVRSVDQCRKLSLMSSYIQTAI